MKAAADLRIEMREHIELLHAAGFALVPLCRPTGNGHCSARWHGACDRAGKRPLIRGYPDFALRRPERAEVQRMFAQCFPCNVGIVTGGSVAGGGTLLALDTDSAEAEAEVVRLAGDVLLVTPTRERRPGRGRVWLFSAPGDAENKNRAGLGAAGKIDVRGLAGLVVVPPSVHVTGHAFEWVAGLAPWQVAPPRLPAGLLALLARPAPRPPRARTFSAPVDVRAEVSPRVALLIRSESTIARLWNGTGKTAGDLTRSGYDFSLARALLARRVPGREVVAALLARPGAHSRHADQASETVARAAATLEERRS